MAQSSEQQPESAAAPQCASEFAQEAWEQEASAYGGPDVLPAGAPEPLAHESRAKVAAEAATVAAAQQIKDQARKVARRLRQRTRQALAQQKERAADEVSHVSAAVQEAAQKLHQENDHAAGSYFERLARRGERAAHYLHEQDVDQVLARARRTMQRRPVLLMSALFLGGLAVGQWARRANRRQRIAQSSTQGELWPEANRAAVPAGYAPEPPLV